MPSPPLSTLKFDILRRTPADLTLGGLTGGQSRVQRVVSAVATRKHRETCEPNVRAWMDGASSEEDGAETAPGASAWVQARPVGPTSILHDTHPLQDRYSRLRLMVPLCASDPLRQRTYIYRRCACGTSMEPLAYHALVFSRAQMSGKLVVGWLGRAPPHFIAHPHATCRLKRHLSVFFFCFAI